jgi:hypothetical protein
MVHQVVCCTASFVCKQGAAVVAIEGISKKFNRIADIARKTADQPRSSLTWVDWVMNTLGFGAAPRALQPRRLANELEIDPALARV